MPNPKGGLPPIFPDFSMPSASVVKVLPSVIESGGAGKLQDLSALGAAGIIWRMLIQTSSDPTLVELIIYDYDDITAGTTVTLNNILAKASTRYAVKGALVMLAAAKAADGADLGHMFGYIVPGGTIYATTTKIEAASSGTTAPSFKLNASDGIDVTAHGSFATRISGLLVVFYA